MRKNFLLYITIPFLLILFPNSYGEEARIIISGEDSPAYNQIHKFIITGTGDLVNSGKSQLRVYDKNNGEVIFENIIVLKEPYAWEAHIAYPSFNENQTYVIEVTNGNSVSTFEFTPVRKEVEQSVLFPRNESVWVFAGKTINFKHEGGIVKKAHFDKEEHKITITLNQGFDGYLLMKIPRDLLNSFMFCKEVSFDVYFADSIYGHTYYDIDFLEDTSEDINTRIIIIKLKPGQGGDLEIVGTHALMSLDEIKGKACTNTKIGTGNSRNLMIAETTDKPGIFLNDSIDYVDDLGYLHIIGEVINNQDKAYEFLKVIATLYDKDHNVLDTNFVYSDVAVIPPYGKSTFDIVFKGGSAGVTDYKVEMEGIESNPLPMGLKLGLAEISGVDILGNYLVTGEVFNKGKTTAHYVKVSGLLYDEDKNLLSVDYTFTELTDIYPGQSSPFELVFPNIMGVPESFEIYAGSEEYGMIYNLPTKNENLEEDTPLVSTKSENQDKNQNDQPKKSLTCGTGTVEKDGVCVPVQEKQGGGCLIATAAFGSELAPQVQMLRETRDNVVMTTQSGAVFMANFNSVYYSFAPTVAEWERENPVFKEIVKATITPLIATLSILNHLNIDSEAEMLGYGIGVIALNIGMYFVAPIFVIMKLRNPIKHKLERK